MDTDNTGAGSEAPQMILGGLVTCWACRHSLSMRELFCHTCGCVQPPRDLGPYARLGLETRFDIDVAVLERVYAGFMRNLDLSRFADRGEMERDFVQRHAQSLRHAYDTLKDPVARARYLLTLEGQSVMEADRDPAGLESALAAATDAQRVDVVASRAGQALEVCVRALAAAFREGDLAAAAATTAELEALDKVAAGARAKRSALQDEDS